VCFNSTGNGLPDASGWVLLIGEPIGMLAALFIAWNDQVMESLRRLVSSLRGRILAGGVFVAVLSGLGGAGARVVAARTPITHLPAAPLPETYPRLDQAFPAMSGLVDQRGDRFSLASLRGRAAIVTFGFGHCETVCPMLVHAARLARTELAAEGIDLAVVVLTLDPWRDTPSSLPGLAARWELGEDDVLLSGSIDRVQAALDAWNVARHRDEATGDITHPALAFLVESDGTVAYATTGSRSQITELARRLPVSMDGTTEQGRPRRRAREVYDVDSPTLERPYAPSLPDFAGRPAFAGPSGGLLEGGGPRRGGRRTGRSAADPRPDPLRAHVLRVPHHRRRKPGGPRPGERPSAPRT
jgi:protein SCO1/2